MPVYSWSQTAANNGTADATINFAEGMAASALNDSARAMMAAIAKWRDDISGSLVANGPAPNFTITSNSSFGSLANMTGQTIRFKMGAASTGSDTLNVDALGAKPLFAKTVAVGAGQLVSGAIYCATYDGTNWNLWVSP